MAEEGRRKLPVIYILATAVLVSLVLIGFLGVYLQEAMKEIKVTQEMLDRLSRRMEETAAYVAIGKITLSFMPFQQVKPVKGDTVTYILGFVGVANLTNIVVRPIVVTVLFFPNVTYPPDGTVTYDYTPSLQLEMAAPELESFELPWGAWPITLAHFVAGDEILWNMRVEAQVTWMGQNVTTTALDVTYKLTVVA